MTSAGELSHRVAFEKRVEQDDGFGNTVEDFAEQFVVAAKVQAKFGGEGVTAARLAGQQPVLVVVRQSSQTDQVTPEWRCRDVRTGTEYNIRSIADPDDAGAFWEMLCQSGTGVAT